jgi:predicted metalloprotease with PDZ domain
MDDVMRHLFATYVTGPAKEGKGWIGVGFPRDGILKALNDVSGKDFKEFYDKYVSGAEELPYEEVFAAAGLAFSLSQKVNDLALPLRGRTLDAIPAGSDAEKAGFKRGDRITAIGGETVDGATYRDVLSKLTVGNEVKVTVDRGGETVELKAKVSVRDRAGATLKRAEKATEIQKKIVDGWLWKEDY